MNKRRKKYKISKREQCKNITSRRRQLVNSKMRMENDVNGEKIEKNLINRGNEENKIENEDEGETVNDEGEIVNDAVQIETTDYERQKGKDELEIVNDELEHGVVEIENEEDEDEYCASDNTDDTVINDSSQNLFKDIMSRRITDLKEIQNYGDACSKHNCGDPDIVIHKEIQRRGLFSKFQCICNNCDETVYVFENAPESYRDKHGKIKYTINFEAALSQLTGDGSHTKLSTTLSFCGVPCMHKSTFIGLRNYIDEDAWLLSKQQMKLAGEIEKANAIEKDQYWWDPKLKVFVPAIRVKVDVAWSHTAHHHHNMSASASEVVVIGSYSGLPLHSETRQKTCQECERAEEEGRVLLPEDHTRGVCYRNVPRNTSSKSMEPDMVFEAFSTSRKTHGIVYIEYVADGDTDLGTHLRKVEYANKIFRIPCCNHRTKNYRSEIEVFAKSNPRFETHLGFTPQRRVGIVAGTRTAMKVRNKEVQEILEAIKELGPEEEEEEKREELKQKLLLVKTKLQNDLKYGWRHKFGIHTKCSGDWCHVSSKSKQTGEVSADIFEDWNIPEPTVRKRGKPASEEEKKSLFNKMQRCSDRLADDYLGLINNETTNACENKFSIRQSMLSKNKSTTRAGAHHTSVGMSTLRLAIGPSYIGELHRKCTSKIPAPHLQETIRSIKRKASYSKQYQEREETKKRRRYLKQRKTGVRTKSRLKGHGDIEEDLPKNEMMEKIKDLSETLKNNIRQATADHQKKSEKLIARVKSELGSDAAKELENIIGTGENTKQMAFINQISEEEEWSNCRQNLLTSSNFHRIISKRSATDCSVTVEDIKYPRNLSNKVEINYGKVNEKRAVGDLKKSRSDLLIVDDLGLFQNEKYPWLGATPDGLVCNPKKTDNEKWGSLEIKCPYSCRETTPEDAKNVFGKDGKVKKTHNYYRQVQGQMGCIGVKWGLLIIWTPQKFYTEEIIFDVPEWEKNVKNLNIFWKNAYAPEIVDSRVVKGGAVRSWSFADGDVWEND